jgi:hypothetical protein
MIWKEPHPLHLPSPAEIELSLAKIRESEQKIREIAALAKSKATYLPPLLLLPVIASG